MNAFDAAEPGLHLAMRVNSTDTPFAGANEMRGRCRDFNWSATSLGSVEEWPNSLRTAAAMVLGSGFPMVLLWGPDLIQIYNDGYIPFLAAKHPSGLGISNRECWPEVWQLNESIYRRVFGGETVSFQDAHYPVRRQGDAGLVEDLYIPLSYGPVPDEAGVIRGVLVTLLDTTANVNIRLAEAERTRLAEVIQAERINLLEQVFCESPSFLHVLRGPDFVFELANEAYYELVGKRKLIGRSAFEAMPEAASGGFQERIARVMSTREPFFARELPIMLARNVEAPAEERLIDLVYLPLIDADGSCTRVLGHGTDVTDVVKERRAGEALALRTAAAEAANRAKSEFLAVISHELRTPLNAIGGYVELIEIGVYGQISPAQATALARIQHSQKHLLGLIDGVLDFVGVDAGAVSFDVAAVNLGDVLAMCETLIAPQVRAKVLTLHIHQCDPTLQASADRDKVHQVVLNLLSNAVKFTDEGGRIDMSCAVVGDPIAGRISISVADTGRGIIADQLDRVFEPFVQVDPTLTRSQDGIGLGLAISRELARGMCGDLTAISTPGVGSTFTLTLPVSSVSDEA